MKGGQLFELDTRSTGNSASLSIPSSDIVHGSHQQSTQAASVPATNTQGTNNGAGGGGNVIDDIWPSDPESNYAHEW